MILTVSFAATFRNVVLLVLLAGFTTGVCARTLTDNHFFLYGQLNWHSRDGVINFGNGRLQHFERNLLRTQGIAVGRNFRLPFGLRVALPLFFEFGSVREGTVEGVTLEDGTSPVLRYNSVMYCGGCQPLIQFPLRLSDAAWAFAAIGGGINYVALFEEERIGDDRNTRVIDTYMEKSKRISASAATGAGMEFKITPRLLFAVNYLFRFWKPVKRKTSRDLFPLEKLPYAERFFSHGISAGFLVSLIP
jgi:hypothetical protein